MKKIAIQKLVDQELSRMIKGNPTDFVRFMLIKMGEMLIEANAATMKMKQESTLNNTRYEVTCNIVVKKVKQPIPTPMTGENKPG